MRCLIASACRTACAGDWCPRWQHFPCRTVIPPGVTARTGAVYDATLCPDSSDAIAGLRPDGSGGSPLLRPSRALAIAAGIPARKGQPARDEERPDEKSRQPARAAVRVAEQGAGKDVASHNRTTRQARTRLTHGVTIKESWGARPTSSAIRQP